MKSANYTIEDTLAGAVGPAITVSKISTSFFYLVYQIFITKMTTLIKVLTI